MPVYLRNFYFKKLIKIKEEEQKQIEDAQQGNKSKINRPDIQSGFKQ